VGDGGVKRCAVPGQLEATQPIAWRMVEADDANRWTASTYTHLRLLNPLPASVTSLSGLFCMMNGCPARVTETARYDYSAPYVALDCKLIIAW
jgi:hypothetical protein